ncbi:MAG: YceI family protein [Actinobacteria bacterium]|nr:YceI family protein [Actinomycetota bacterium]
MSDLATHPLTGTWRAQPVASTFAFKVRHSDTFWFRGVMPEAEATLRGDQDGPALEGAAKVESITVFEPPELRAHLLAADFFDAENHPDVSFRSNDLRLRDDGRIDLEGELTIGGITRPIAATGQWSGPRQAAFGEIAGLSLRAAFDRRGFGFGWQAEMPDGGEALGWEVGLEVDLLLVRQCPPGSRSVVCSVQTVDFTIVSISASTIAGDLPLSETGWVIANKFMPEGKQEGIQE